MSYRVEACSWRQSIKQRISLYRGPPFLEFTPNLNRFASKDMCQVCRARRSRGFWTSLKWVTQTIIAQYIWINVEQTFWQPFWPQTAAYVAASYPSQLWYAKINAGVNNFATICKLVIDTYYSRWWNVGTIIKLYFLDIIKLYIKKFK